MSKMIVSENKRFFVITSKHPDLTDLEVVTSFEQIYASNNLTLVVSEDLATAIDAVNHFNEVSSLRPGLLGFKPYFVYLDSQHEIVTKTIVRSSPLLDRTHFELLNAMNSKEDDPNESDTSKGDLEILVNRVADTSIDVGADGYDEEDV